MQDTNKRQNLDVILVIIGAVAVISTMLYLALTHPHITVKYDCSISEISPDYPVAVKEKCRELRAGKFLQSPK